MEQIRAILEEGIGPQLYQAVLSNPRSGCTASKVKIRPVMIGGTLRFQESRMEGGKALHTNRSAGETREAALTAMEREFKQLEIQTAAFYATALVSKKGKVTVRKKKWKEAEAGGAANRLRPDLSHNRAKRYLLEEGVPVGFLIDLGVQTRDGAIVRRRYDKFRQINRFLECIDDILPILPTERPIRIVDFGCGKSYLTFAIYHYFTKLRGRAVEITGLDRKEDVIRLCTGLRDKYGYDGLHFAQGDIAGFQPEGKIDMVVTLHACDTATDAALCQAVGWGADVILSVPCCQHELNGKIDCALLEPVLRYGLLRERIAALLTDGMRAELLEQMGYETQILELTGMEYTPKNVLIRAVRKREPRPETEAFRKLREFLGASPALQAMLEKAGTEKPHEKDGH